LLQGEQSKDEKSLSALFASILSERKNLHTLGTNVARSEALVRALQRNHSLIACQGIWGANLDGVLHFNQVRDEQC
jgi:hypothetical protein